MIKTTLITGATGFIGSHLVEHLVNQGRKVRCLARSTSDINFLKKHKVEIVIGDLLDQKSLNNAVKGVDTIFHLAACVRPLKTIYRSGQLSDLYNNVNTLGTKNIIEAILKENISKFIHFSSISAIGGGMNLTEDSTCPPITAYGQSKLEAEKHILAAIKNHNLPAIIIRPGQTYGPRSLGMLTFFKLIKKGVFFTIGDGSHYLPVCYVEDLIKGTLLAEEKGRIGEAYFLFENCYQFRPYLKTIAKTIKGNVSPLYIPKNLANISVFIKELTEKVLHLKICPLRMDIGKNGIKAMSSNWHGTASKAKNTLGYRPTINIEEGMKLTSKWYKELNLI